MINNNLVNSQILKFIRNFEVYSVVLLDVEFGCLKLIVTVYRFIWVIDQACAVTMVGNWLSSKFNVFMDRRRNRKFIV